jgi:hypothetical protein
MSDGPQKAPYTKSLHLKKCFQDPMPQTGTASDDLHSKHALQHALRRRGQVIGTTSAVQGAEARLLNPKVGSGTISRSTPKPAGPSASPKPNPVGSVGGDRWSGEHRRRSDRWRQPRRRWRDQQRRRPHRRPHRRSRPQPEAEDLDRYVRSGRLRDSYHPRDRRRPSRALRASGNIAACSAGSS